MESELCYFYYDRRSTIVVATTDIATSVVLTSVAGTAKKAFMGTMRRRTRQSRVRKGIQMTEISSDIIRGYNDTMILFLLLNEPSYGYELSKQIKTLTEGKYVIKETTLYSAFSRMEKNGYIESFESEAPTTGKKRTYYRITDLGRSYYNEKCEEWRLTKEVVERFVSR